MNLKESQTIELKESWRDEYLKTIAAFANTDGGFMLIGYDDNGNLKGVEKSDKLLEDLPNKIINMLGITTSITPQKAGDKNAIMIQVEKSKNPVSFQSRFYVRSGSTTQELKGTELQNYILRANNMTWDEVTMPQADFDDIDRETVARFVRRAVDYNRLPATTDANNLPLLFNNLNLTDENGELTRASLLLFGKRTQRWFLQARFKIGRFNGSSSTALMVHDAVEGNLFEMPDKVMDLLKAKYLLSPIHYEGLQRVEALEIPEKAMREAVLNAIIHRDYASTSNIDLRIFDNTISLWNHGDLPPQLDIEKLKDTHASYPRNKLIANIFYRAGYIEAWGRGIQTIVEEVVTNGLLSPTFTNDKWSFTVTFYRKQAEELSLQQKQSDQTGDVVTPSITELERKSLEVIGQKLTGTHKEFAEILEIGAENGTRVTKKGTEKISEKGTESETKVTENGKRVTENETKVTENKTKVTENGTEVTENEKRVTEKGTEKISEKGTEKVAEKVTENQQMILDCISQNPRITSEELAKIIGISLRKIKANISKLKSKGLLERIGPDKGGYWKVIKKI